MKTLVMILLFVLPLTSLAQGFEDIYEHGTDLHIIKSSPGYVSFGFQVATGHEGKFKLSIEYTSLAVPDIAIIATLNTLTGSHPDKSPFTNLFGSLALGLNVISTDKLIVSAGGNITDYQMKDGIPEGIYSGYAFYTAGSYLRADYLIKDGLMLRVRNYLSKSFKNGSTILDMSNPQEGLSPLFIRTGAEIHFKSRWMGGIELYNLTNYPGVSESRLNIRVGYKVG
jgi:hypothetical protein